MGDSDADFDESDGEYDVEFNEDSNSEPDADLENQYYNSKVLRADPIKALDSFKKVLEMEEKSQVKGEWGFRSLKQMIKLLFAMGDFEEMMKCYNQLLEYIKCAVTSNHTEKSILSILDFISSSKSPELLDKYYETTLKALKDNQNDRLWFKTSLKLAKVHLERQNFLKLTELLNHLRLVGAQNEDSKNGTQMLEILALEIQMHTCQKNTKKLHQLYNQSLNIKSAIPHPYIMGIIRECGGKMHLTDGQFDEATTDFFEAFKNYDDAGSPRRTASLKYLVLTNMLNKSKINPFDCPETKPYKGNPEVQAMTSLISAYQAGDLKQFENIFRENREFLMDDTFIKEHIEILITNCRVQALLKMIHPYSRISILTIANALNITKDEVESLLVTCILDGTVKGKIDQVNSMLILKKTGCVEPCYLAIDNWVAELDSLSSSIANRLI